MKRLALYALILALVWILPIERTDVAQLRPVEVIAIYKEGDTVILATDMEDIGIGTDTASALENMRQTSSAVIYLDTAEYLLIGQNAEKDALALRDSLKGSMQLCMTAYNVDLKDAAKYLPVHGKLPNLRDWEAGQTLPVLQSENGRIKISENR